MAWPRRVHGPRAVSARAARHRGPGGGRALHRRPTAAQSLTRVLADPSTRSRTSSARLPRFAPRHAELQATVAQLRSDPDAIEETRSRAAGPRQARRPRAQAPAVIRRPVTADGAPLRALRDRLRAERARVLQAGPGLEGHADHGPASCGRRTRGSTSCRPRRHSSGTPRAPVFLHLVPAYQEPDIATTVSALVASRYPHGRLHVVVITKEEEERAPHPGMIASTGELVRRLRDGLPPYQQKRLTHLVMPGPGRKAHQLNWALRPRGARRDPGRGRRSRARLRRRQRRGLAARSRHVPLDRPPRADGAGRAGVSGHHAVARQLRSPADPRKDLRHPAVLDLHPRVAGAAHQRGQAPAPVRAMRIPRAPAGPSGPSGLRVLLPPRADLPRPQPVRAPGYARVARRLPRPRAPPRTPRSAMRSAGAASSSRRCPWSS